MKRLDIIFYFFALVLMTGCSKLTIPLIHTSGISLGAIGIGLLLVLVSAGGERKAASSLSAIAGAAIFLWG